VYITKILGTIVYRCQIWFFTK